MNASRLTWMRRIGRLGAAGWLVVPENPQVLLETAGRARALRPVAPLPEIRHRGEPGWPQLLATRKLRPFEMFPIPALLRSHGIRNSIDHERAGQEVVYEVLFCSFLLSPIR
jgi:hypothetical protein